MNFGLSAFEINLLLALTTAAAFASVLATTEQPREPWMCVAHLRDRSGRQCRKVRMKGQLVCASHGGLAPQTLAAARQRLLLEIDPVVAAMINTALHGPNDQLKLRAQIAVCDYAFGSNAEPRVAVEGGRAPSYLRWLTTEELTGLFALIERATARMRSGETPTPGAPPPVEGEVIEVAVG